MLQKTLKIVPPPLALAAVANAPPVLEEAGPTVEYACGHCGAALMRVDQSKPCVLMVHCTECDAYNSTAGAPGGMGIEGTAIEPCDQSRGGADSICDPGWLGVARQDKNASVGPPES
jgi:hypothetical protein